MCGKKKKMVNSRRLQLDWMCLSVHKHIHRWTYTSIERAELQFTVLVVHWRYFFSPFLLILFLILFFFSSSSLNSTLLLDLLLFLTYLVGYFSSFSSLLHLISLYDIRSFPLVYTLLLQERHGMTLFFSTLKAKKEKERKPNHWKE